MTTQRLFIFLFGLLLNMIPALSFSQKSLDFDLEKWKTNSLDSNNNYYRSKIEPNHLIAILKGKKVNEVINTLGNPNEIVAVKKNRTLFYKYLFNSSTNLDNNQTENIEKSYFMIIIIKNSIVDIVKVP